MESGPSVGVCLGGRCRARRSEESGRLAQDLFERMQFAFPECERFPAQRGQIMAVAAITGDIGVQLRVPISGIGRGAAAPHGAVMSMPKTAVHKNHLVSGGEYQIRRARQLAATQANVWMPRTECG